MTKRIEYTVETDPETGKEFRWRVCPEAKCLQGWRHTGKSHQPSRPEDGVLTGVDAIVLLLFHNGPMRTAEIRDSWSTWLDGRATYDRVTRQVWKGYNPRTNPRGTVGYESKDAWEIRRNIPVSLTKSGSHCGTRPSDMFKEVRRTIGGAWNRRRRAYNRTHGVKVTTVPLYWYNMGHGLWCITAGGIARAGEILEARGDLP